MMKEIGFKGLALIGIAGMTLAAAAFEPAEGPGIKRVPIQSQETVASQQVHNGVAPVVGSVELSPRQPAPPVKSPSQAAGSPGKPEARAVEGGSIMESASAAKLLRKVELDQQMAATAPFRTIIWAVVVVGIGLGLAFLVKFFADKSMPQVPTKSRVRW